jgi:hypothetical protein
MVPVQASVILGGAQTMTRSPKEYRRHAARCAELAMVARTPQLKATFLGLSKNWEKFAIDLEAAFGGAAVASSGVRQSLAESKELSNLLYSQQYFYSDLYFLRQVRAYCRRNSAPVASNLVGRVEYVSVDPIRAVSLCL